MGPGLGIKLQAQTEWQSPSTLVTSINHLTAKTLRAWQNFKTLKQTVKFTICVCPHKCASSILQCHKMNQPDDSDCNWVLRLSIGTPGEWQTEPAIWKKKKDSTRRCRHPGKHRGEASLLLYDANCIQTPTHCEESAKARQTARGNTLPFS